MDLRERLDTLVEAAVTNPYRHAPRKPHAARARRRASHFAVVVAIVWGLSLMRLAVAFEQDERLSFEPALAALLSVAPPVALLFRQGREACLSDVLEAAEEPGPRDDPPGAG